MERLIVTGQELTGGTHSAYSSGRGIFMPDGNGSPDIGPHQKVPETQIHDEAIKLTPDQLRAKWESSLTPEGLDRGARETIEILVGQGIGPETVTSKGPVEQKAEDVIKTSQIVDDNTRLRKAETLLNSLKPEEQVKLIGDDGEPTDMGKAVLSAHRSEGKAYRLTKEQLLKRTRILEKAGFSKEQRKTIIEAGIVAPVDAAEAEAEAIQKYFVFTADPILSPHVGAVNNFMIQARSGSYSKAEHERVTNALRDLDPTVGMSDAERRVFEEGSRRIDFEMARATLLADIAEKTSQYTGAREREDVKAFKERVSELSGLMKDTDYDGIEAFFNNDEKSDMERSTYSETLSQSIRNLQAEIAADPDNAELAKRYEQVIEFAMEYALERIINLGDISPKSEYPRFNLYQSDNLDRITQIARVYDETRRGRYGEGHGGTEMFNYIVSLKIYRQAMHELFRGMKDEKTYLGLVTGLLRKGGLAFVEKQVVGVSDVQIVYEQMLASALALKKQGWLTDQDLERIDADTLSRLRTYQGFDFFKKRINHADGTSSQRGLREWETSRAGLMGRSLSAASQRRLVYEVLGDVPKDGPVSYKSVESEFIARRLALIKLIPDRFFGQPESKRLLGFLEEELMRDPNTDQIDRTKYGYVSGGEARGLYGNSQRAFAYLDTGVVDPKSNSWRGNLIFLRQKGYEITVGGERKLLGDYFEEQLETAEHEAVLREPGCTRERLEELKKEIFNHNVQGVVAQQRLFLGVLMRNGNLNGENKEMIWRNVAGLLPSRIAAFFPKETLELMGGDEGTRVDRWISLRNKLFIAEMARVKNDANFIKNGEGAIKDLREFYAVAGLTAEEIAITREIANLGTHHARDLAKMTFPFVAFLDDVPETGWDELADEDYDRILINDQSAFAEGYGQMVGLIAHPVKPQAEIVEAFHGAVEKIESPLGIETAQKKLEPFVMAVIRMRTSSHAAKWLGSAMRLARLPRSEMEKFNLQSQIAEDEEQTRNLLTALAQKDVISDNPAELDKKGRTQYFRLLDKAKANRRRQIYRLGRLLLMILGPEFAKAFMGAGLLDDIEGLD